MGGAPLSRPKPDPTPTAPSPDIFSFRSMATIVDIRTAEAQQVCALPVLPFALQ
jgi:hypothetical protein